MKKHLLHVIVALNIALALVLLFLWIDPPGRIRNVHWIAPSPQAADYASMVPDMPVIVPADTSQFIAMLDRPVFSPTRRPPPSTPPPEEKAPTDNLSAALLSGLFQGGGDGGAIIQIAGKHKRVRLREVVEGWTLSAIQDRSVIFTLGGQSRVLQLPRAAVTSYADLPPAAGSAIPSVPRNSSTPASKNVPPPSVNSEPVQPRAAGRPAQPVFGGSASQ